MPKVNQTMLDKLVDAFKGGSQRKPEIIEATTIRDPLGYSMVQRRFGTATGKLPSMTPERQLYQKGLNILVDTKKKPVRDKWLETGEELSWLQDDFENAFDEAKENYIEQVRDNMEQLNAPDLRSGFDPSYDLDPHVPSETLEPYWPDYDYKPVSYYNSRGGELGDQMDEYERQMDYIDSPQYRMELQRQSPRYRRYQDAMQRRDIERRAGRVNAAIMNLARQGYSLPEIREILRRQRR